MDNAESVPEMYAGGLADTFQSSGEHRQRIERFLTKSPCELLERDIVVKTFLGDSYLKNERRATYRL